MDGIREVYLPLPTHSMWFSPEHPLQGLEGSREGPGTAPQ